MVKVVARVGILVPTFIIVEKNSLGKCGRRIWSKKGRL